MKKIRFTLFALTAMTAVSCVKDIVTENDTQFTPEKDMINMVFTADAEKENSTKAGLEGKSVVWADGDAIKVFASNNTNNNTGSELIETSVNGTSATFEGEVEMAESYYAIYPATAGVSLTTTTVNSETVTAIEAVVPAEQSAVAGSFDPKAFIAAAMPGEEVTNFSFKNVGTLVKFQLEDAESVEYVTFSGNNNETLAGTGYITFENGLPTHRNVTGSTASKVVSLSSDSWTEGQDYYMVVRPSTFEKGITVAVHYSNGAIKYKSSSTKVSETTTRNKVLNLGMLTGLSEDTPNDLYVAWLHGYDIKIGEQTFNSNNYTAILVESDIDLKNTITGTNKSGVYFLTASENTTYTLSATVNLQSDIILVSRYTDDTATIEDASRISLQGGAIYFKNLNINLNSSATYPELFYNYNQTTTTKAIVIDDCKINNIHGNIFNICGSSVVNTIEILNSDLSFINSINDFKSIITDNQSHTLPNIVFNNNILYCNNTDRNITLFQGANASITNFIFEQNSLINLYPTDANRYVKASAVTNVSMGKNLFYLPKFSDSAYAGDKNNSGKYLSIFDLQTYPEASNITMTTPKGFVYYENTPAANPLKGFKVDITNSTNQTDYNPYMSNGNNDPTITIDWDTLTFSCTGSYGATR